MKKTAYVCCAAIALICMACTGRQQQKARERAAEAKDKTREETAGARHELKNLGQRAKREAQKLRSDVNQAFTGGASGGGNTAEAKRKLDDAGHEMREVGENASVKLKRAALIAKVKAKLAADAGLSTAAHVDVDASGRVITLRGTVSSEAQRQEAEQAAMQVNGVTRVVNLVEVK